MSEKAQQNYINHIGLVLDASSSMSPHTSSVIKVADTQIAYLAQRSKDLDQETRVTVYTFSSRDNERCLIYDKDVLRMPSISGLYKPWGMTALVDATLLSISDLAMTPEKYGEHAFLIYVLTDGQENNSRQRPNILTHKISTLLDHWTLAAFVPDQTGKFEAKKFGFPADNIAIWDIMSAHGVAEVGETIRKATDTFMENRAKGIRGTKSLFTLQTLSAGEITSSLTPLTPGSYYFLNVAVAGRIDECVRNSGASYVPGNAYYQLTKAETVQPQKSVAILHKGNVYMGSNARQMLGLPDGLHARVKPGDHPDYTIFVQSTSMNRKLITGTQLLVMR